MKLERGKNQKIEKCVRREVCNVVTKGTFKDPNNLSYEPKFVLAVKKYGNEIGVTFFELSTLKFYVG